MSEAKHTPGPWSRDKYGHIVDSAGNDVRFRSLTILSSGGDESMAQAEANTTLAAAAPDLLFIARQWAALDAGDWHVVRHASEKAQLMADTLALIAKATEAQ